MDWLLDMQKTLLGICAEYNEEGVRGLIDDLMLSYKIEEV